MECIQNKKEGHIY